MDLSSRAWSRQGVEAWISHPTHGVGREWKDYSLTYAAHEVARDWKDGSLVFNSIN